MTSVGLTRLRDVLGDTVDRVQRGGERVLLERNGKPVAALVSVEDLRLLEELEDRLDAEEIERVLSDPNEEWIPWERVKAQSESLP